MADEYPLYDKVHEAVSKFREETGHEPNQVKLHPMTRNELLRELERLNSEPIKNRDRVKVAGCWMGASLTCPRDHVLVSEE